VAFLYDGGSAVRGGIVGLAFALPTGPRFYVPVRQPLLGAAPSLPEAEVLNGLAELFASPTVAKHVHDAKALQVLLRVRGGQLAVVASDTMLAGYVLDSASGEYDLSALAGELGIEHPVDALETAPGRMPMSFGMLRPAVFMPADSAEWSEDRRRVVLLHELAHVRRGDHAKHLCARVALCAYWWNPLAWLAWRAFLKERERATDDLVLAAGARASDYAAHLLEIARSMRSAPALSAAAVAVARRSQLEGRLLAILDSARNRKSPGRAGALAAAVICAAVVIPLAALQAQDNSQPLPADINGAIRAAVAQRNHEALENLAKTAEEQLQYDVAQRVLESALAIQEQNSGSKSVEYGKELVRLGDVQHKRGDAQANATGGFRVRADHHRGVGRLVVDPGNRWLLPFFAFRRVGCSCQQRPVGEGCGGRAVQLCELLAPGGAAAGVALWIGPESGWTEEELEVLKVAGAEPARLGRGVLRTETAGAVAVAVARLALGDW